MAWSLGLELEGLDDDSPKAYSLKDVKYVLKSDLILTWGGEYIIIV